MAEIPTVWTIGYESTGFDGLLATLRGAGVTKVADVRELPLSRHAGFSKRMLAASLAAAGLDYVHLRALGTPKEGRLAARSGDRARFWSIVEQRLQTPEAELELLHLAEIARAQPTALLCLEADPMVCHRRRIAEALAARFGFRVEHLRVDPAGP